MSDYKKIAEHYEACLEKNGPGHKGMDWPKEEDLTKRFEVMLGVAAKEKGKVSILDLGCGSGLLVGHLKKNKLLDKFAYTGMDISEKMIKAAKAEWPDYKFEARDILKAPLEENEYDYVVMNGLMTEKVSLSQADMVQFAGSIIKAGFKAAKKGIAYNVMSEHVDWKRDDLFHWPFDEAMNFLKENCSRHVVFRADYGLYEYTTYVYKRAN